MTNRTVLRTAFPLVVACALSVCAGAAEQPSLKDVFRNHFLVGSALNPGQFTEQDAGGAALVKKHFNTITPENVLKWGLVHPRDGAYDFGLADQYVQFGEKNGMKIIGHTLIWHQQTPDWVFKDADGTANRDFLLARMQDHIQTVVGRYKGRIAGWDVVNEVLDEDGKLRESRWLKIIGPDYIAKAFQFAHEADPEAELYYNDYSLENAPKREGAVKLIKELQAQGIPVAGIGLQGHYKMDWPKPRDVHRTINTFAALGMKCMITELDVDVLPSRRGGAAEVTLREEATKASNPYAFGLPKKESQALARRYADLFHVFVRNQEHLDRVTFWGVTDKDTWLNNWPVRGRTNHPLLFDRNGETKPAFDAVIRTVDN